MRPTTYREWIYLSGRTDRRGGYGRSVDGVSRGLRDMWHVSRRWLRYPLKVAVLGYDQPQIVDWNQGDRSAAI